MSDEVSQFLEQVERLRGQQVDDDEVRARELEEYLAAKRERQARREERARSISPQKSSPVNTPSPRSNRRSAHLSDAPKLESPTAVRERSAEPSVDAGPMALSSSPTKENEAPADSAEAKRAGVSAPSARSSPLSWQRRPNSRPLSMVAAQNATQRSLAGTHEPPSATEPAFSNEQIAQALGSKDPAWFRQTADRGLGSAALRRSQVEDDDRLDMTSVKAQLPGMAAETPRERVASPTQPRLGSPVSLEPPRNDVPADDRPAPDQAGAVPAGRTSPIRSTSPTKGMGGFVQSAMMKRSDSVKRWSVTSPPGLTRADSVAANRSAHERGPSQPGSRPSSLIRNGSPGPGSGHGEDGAQQPVASKPASGVDLTVDTERASKRDDDAVLPSSPTKTMDPRRWSPTKSSWLESALNKPDSPKLPPKPSQSQPAWMVELNKARAERANSASSDAARQPAVAHKHQVSIGGLMRQSPVGETAKTNPTGLGGIYSPPASTGRPTFGHQAKPSIDKALDRPPKEAPAPAPDDQGAAAPDRRRPSVASPPQAKPRPETPPNKDFRTSLRQRPAASDASKAEEPEFKNVFGNLRRTKTQNYVAPDELKDNILRGKAALNLTDGPRKGERKDEFKEAILKKREDFKKAQAEGKGVRTGSVSSADKPVPESLAKRVELGRPTTAAREGAMDSGPKDAPQPAAASPKPPTGPKRTPSQSAFATRSPNTPPPPSQRPGSGQSRAASEDAAAVKPAPEPKGRQGAQKESAPAPPKPPQARPGAGGGTGKLADRFNPALAGMLARGPPGMAANGGGPRPGPGAGDGAEPTGPGPQLTHMTKNRARGPRRKAPTGSSTATPASSISRSLESSAAPASQEPGTLSEPDRQKAPDSRPEAEHGAESRAPATESEKPPPLSIQQQVAAKAALRNRPAPTKAEVQAEAKPEAKPEATSGESAADTTEATAPPSPRKRTMSPEAKDGSQVSPSLPQETAAEEGAPQPGSPRKLDMKRMSRFLDDAPADKAQQGLAREPAVLAHRRTGSTSPTKLPERTLPDAPASPGKGGGDGPPSVREAAARLSRSSSPVKPPPSSAAPPSTTATASSRPQSRGPVRPLSGSGGPGAKSPPPPAAASPVRSPTKQASEVATLLTDLFGPPVPRQEVRVDTAEILMKGPAAGAKITSLGFQMFRIFGDGKKTAVSAQNERVLFEQEMYVCAHHFRRADGSKVFEVYFWVGDEVAEAAAAEAQASVQREARSLGGSLVRLRQGQETAEFVQALGGVVIVRRGSSNKYDSLAPNMLCGRRYLGQVAFDEVDFAPASLCSGFTYLMAQAGRCALWKGRGSDVAEVSCARLVGMDLTLTGELAEVDDGAEPAGFWDDVFGGAGAGGARPPPSADHWRLKPGYDKYRSRLFCSDAAAADARHQILEISPFGQADLSPAHIYVLDAFFELYVVVGAGAAAQYASFRNALDFAQEYAILAAGIEDRPFVPVASVVLEGCPRDLKRVFRKWDDRRAPTASAPALRRGRSLRVVSLTQALQALTE
ncbi:hypothetical protein CDD83_4183 [Cordyceps sp. RAO-2017]|nr:hypothetical protein CDD83_4183 [Cordyceps sp. RAO-2017]